MTKIKTALITGANRGIGKTVAKGLALDGYKTILVARNKEQLDVVQKEISELVSGEIKPDTYIIDLADFDATEKLIEEIIENHGLINVLVNNAGIHYGGTIDGGRENLQKLLDINLISPYIFLQKIGKVMLKEGCGHIFNISSRAGKHGFASSGIYSAAKFGFAGLNESLYRELSEKGIKVTAICPAWVNTDMAIEAGSSLDQEDMIKTEDILETIRYNLKLSDMATVKEIVIECRKRVLQ